MMYAAAVLALVMVPRGAPPPDPARQEWLADPVLPAHFAAAELEIEWPEEALSFEIPALAVFDAPPLQDLEPRQEAGEAEPSFPRAITGIDVQRWREEDDLRRVREWISDGTLGLPMFVPQLLMEALIPRGIAVGPTTFLYRTTPGSASLALIVFDQILFHEAEFLASAQAQSADESGTPEDLTRNQRRLFRRAFMGGFRATYAMPGLTMDLVLQTAEDHGALGYLLAPPIGGAVLYFKGLDQKVRLHEDVKLRFKVAAGREWIEGIRSDDGTPVVSFELRFCDFPIGLIGSFDITSRGMIPEFLGIGTSLDAVEELLGREEYVRNPRFRER